VEAGAVGAGFDAGAVRDVVGSGAGKIGPVAGPSGEPGDMDASDVAGPPGVAGSTGAGCADAEAAAAVAPSCRRAEASGSMSGPFCPQPASSNAAQAGSDGFSKRRRRRAPMRSGGKAVGSGMSLIIRMTKPWQSAPEARHGAGSSAPREPSEQEPRFPPRAGSERPPSGCRDRWRLGALKLR